MEAINEIDTIKIEKQKAMHRYRTFQKIANALRTLEISLAIIFISFSISWTSSHIPAIFKISANFLRRLSSILVSPHFVFVIGNVIVITLFANFSSVGNSGDVEQNFDDFSSENADVAFPTAEVPAVVEEKVYRRSKSVAIVQEKVVEKRELRRSATVPRRKFRGGVVSRKEAEAEEARWRRCQEDGLSDEEFNRKVEEFIVKQRRFLSDETNKSLVLSN